MCLKNSLFLICLILFVNFSCSDEKTNLESVEFFNVSYGDNPQQKFDLFLPKNRTQASTKIIVLIHGGGWTSGDKSDLIVVYDYFKTNSNEYAIVNLNYTLADLNTSPIPLQTNDISSFIQYIKARSNEYKINPEFTFIGTSAGAHLSMLYAYKNDTNRDVKVVCNIVGPTNFLHSSYLDSDEPETIELINNVQTIYGLPINENTAFYQSISPFFLVNQLTPPTISFYGGQDFLVPEEQGVILKEALDSHQIVNEYVFYQDEGHGWGNPEFLDTMQKIEAFLTSNF